MTRLACLTLAMAPWLHGQAVFVDTAAKKPTPIPSGQGSQGTSAISQLEAITGKTIDRSRLGTAFVLRSRPSTQARLRQANAGATSMVMSWFIGSLFNQASPTDGPGGPDAAEQARFESERQKAFQQEQAELRTWATQYSARMNTLVTQQRQQQAQRNQTSLEDLRSSLSDGLDSRAPGLGNDLASALSDPAVVDLSESRTFTPSILRHPDGSWRERPLAADDLLLRREAAQARLRAMMAENADLQILGRRFYELESQLERLKHQAAGLGSEGRALKRDMDRWGWRIEQATQACLERGTSLFTDILLPKGTSVGLKRLQANPNLWPRFVESLSNLNDFSEFSSGLVDRYDAAGQALDWIQAKRNLMRDLDFLATHAASASTRLEPVSVHWQLGKGMVGTAVDLAAELDGWGAILQSQGDAPLLLQKQRALQTRMDAVIRALQTNRTQIASRIGVKPENLIPPPKRPKGLDSWVPPI